MFKRILAVALLLTMLSTATASAQYASGMSAGKLLSLTDSYRASNGLNSLSLNARLTEAAQAKANDMVARDYWSHTTPDGRTPWSFITGYSFRTAGENLAYGYTTSSELMSAWIASPEHRANLVGNYTEVGFGFANSEDYRGTGPETIVVAMYASPYERTQYHAPATTPPAPTPTPESLSTHIEQPGFGLQAPYGNDLQLTINSGKVQG